ncbi:MAG: hypothetical protein QOC92_4861 [Acidimicrobiaceae bacterium]|jgi:hypothetical protein
MRASTQQRRSIWARAGAAVAIASLTLIAVSSAASADPGKNASSDADSGAAFGAAQGSAPVKDNGNGSAQSEAHSSQHANQHQTDGTSGTSGDPSLPQPPSNADANGTGANVDGPYDSTRDGSPSGNGNGNGQATGKPCAGCVGKADNKNPPGQQPGPEDHNNGYECDGNNGIAKTNPAHTGCVDPPPECVSKCAPPECVSKCTPPECVSNCTPPPVCNAAVLKCDETPKTPSAEVLGVSVVRDPGAVDGAALPRTGTNVLDPLAVAALLLAGGGAFVTAGRRLRRRG